MTTHDDLLRLYDAYLRTDAEVPNALSLKRLGPLYLATYPGRRGFVTYADLEGYDGPADGGRLDGLIAAAIAHFRGDVVAFEWKTRGHDRPADLAERLVGAGFVAEEPESVMIGEASKLAIDAPLPPGYALGRATSPADLRAAEAAAGLAFGEDPERSAARAEELVTTLQRDPDAFEFWIVTDADGRVVTTGRLQPVPGTAVAGIWGGSTLPEHRHRGLYRALTAARARSALARGLRWIHSDSTEDSRPILERSGFTKVTTTTPFIWNRALQPQR